MTIHFKHLTEAINQYIAGLPLGGQPAELYEPIRYIMGLGGKRMRPTLVLLGYQLYADDYQKALAPAVAIEVFHNFTLLHDDIMDEAPLRRGQPTVHEKWNQNIGILSGDTMLVKAYDLLIDMEPQLLPTILPLFNRCAVQVCEGQQLDMNFEQMKAVSEEAYLEMIRLKTAVLLGFSLQLGALLGGATDAEAQKLYEFGCNIGIGFQLKDDMLDVFGESEKFGKQVGGDIIANKKTFLLIKALALATGRYAEELQGWLTATDFDKSEKVTAVTNIYNQYEIRQLTAQKMNQYFDKGFSALEQLTANEEKKQLITSYARALVERET